MREITFLRSFVPLAAAALAGCPSSTGTSDAGQTVVDSCPQAAPATGWCAIDGSWKHRECGLENGGGPTDFSWLYIPEGYCVHEFGQVGNARQIRFAPNGDLFVSSPTQGTTGGGAGGQSAIVVLPDDNQDGYADDVVTFRDNLPATQGLMFANGSIYYQFPDVGSPVCGNGATPVSANIVSEPYTSGMRQSSGSQEEVVEILTYCSDLHWPKTLDVADDGTIYVGNGGDQGESCEEPMPVHGGVWKVDGTSDGQNVAWGLRNPIDVKCHHDGNDHCFATELALDYSGAENGREKLILINEGNNWGFPCCASYDSAYTEVCLPCGSPVTVAPSDSSTDCQAISQCSPDCSSISQDTESFTIGNTPFGFDFEDTQFPSPWNHQVFVALHGAAGSWSGARVVAIALDPGTGLPLPASDLSGNDTGAMQDFLTGWDDGQHDHGRPADIALSSDGRLFVANDNNGEIFWIAPNNPPSP